MNLIDRVKNINVTPKTEWEVINAEPADIPKILTGYVIPLVAIGAIAAFIGYGLIGINFGFLRVRGIDWGLRYGISILVTGILGCYIAAFVIDALAPSFKSEKNFGKSFQLVAYAYTPAWIGAILNILPSVAFIGSLFGIYSLYLLYLGLPKLKKTPQDSAVGYFVVSMIVLIVASIVLALILGSILASVMGLGVGAGRLNINY